MTRVAAHIVRPRPERRCELVAGRDFRLKYVRAFSPLLAEPSPRVQDLLGIACAIYSIDRLVRRSSRNLTHGPARAIHLNVSVSDQSFWSNASELLSEILYVLSGDEWTFSFSEARARHWQKPLIERRDAVCLYSGGLDSLAGLAARLDKNKTSIVAATLSHLRCQRRPIERQLQALNHHFGEQILPVAAPMNLVAPRRLCDQELSQRCRGFLFTSLGLAIAETTRANSIELYESGVGSLNVPVMSGMSVAGRSTKGCHPNFLRLMSQLGSAALNRPVRFVLSFADRTKGEVVQAMKDAGLAPLAQTSFSCVHTSPRVKGSPRQCGCCFACVGRRQALRVAGIEDPGTAYMLDLFDSAQVVAATPQQMLSLKTTLMQVEGLLRAPSAELPESVRRYLISSGAVVDPTDMNRFANLLHRYADEWYSIARGAAEQGIGWGHLIEPRERAA